MKLKINKASDLNSISVFPPNSRRSSMIPAQQPRSQPSQQSFSQNAMFSQLSQSSFDELLVENQRFGSQEKDNSVRRVSCLAPISYPREESQLPIPRASANLPRRWSSNVPDQKCQQNDELEHKFSAMETSLSRLGMILDSVQSDIMQVNKGTKELSLTVEGIRQKSIARDDSLHLLSRGQEEIKTSLDVGLRQIVNQLNNTTQQQTMQELMSVVMTLPDQIQANVRKHSEELSRLLSGDLQPLQTIICSLNTLKEKRLPLAILPPKVTGGDSDTSSQSMPKPLDRREPETVKILKQRPLGAKIEPRGWTTVKPKQCAVPNRYGNTCRNLKQKRISPLARPQKVIVHLDDESDDDFSCFVVEKGYDNRFVDEVNEEAEQILRKARRRKRKQSCKKYF